MSLATRLFLLVVLVALPIFAIVVAQEAQLRSARRADIIEQTASAATLAAARQARVSTSAQTLLALAARIPAVRELTPGECSLELARLANTLPGLGGLAVLSPDGARYCTTSPDATTPPIIDRPYFQEAVKSKKLTFSGYIVGRVSGAGNVVFTYPVLEENQDVAAVLVLGVTTQTLSATLNDPPLPAGAFAAVIDRQGIITSRWPAPDEWAGKEFSKTAAGQAAARKSNTFTEDGIEYALVLRPIGDNGDMTMALGLPITPAIAEIGAAFSRSISLMLAAFVLAAISALLIARRWVARPMRELQVAAQAMASGNLAVRPPPASVPEVQALSDQFVAMAQALDLRLRQKDALLKEVNHRVKNSLQLVSSVLMLHRNSLDDEATRRRFDEVAAKIATVARVHQRLYRDDNVDTLAFGAFLSEMCIDLETMVGEHSDRSVQCTAEEHRLPTDVAIPLGLIVNELVTNAAKYGYPAGAPGQIRVDFKREGNVVVTSVSDDGPLPKNFSLQQGGGLGMRLITALLRQLRGTLDVVPLAAGKAFVVRIPA